MERFEMFFGVARCVATLVGSSMCTQLCIYTEILVKMTAGML